MSRATVICILLFIQVKLAVLEDPVVRIETGRIRGRQGTTAESTTYYIFEKIPYAAPPIGNLRFKTPQPVQKWSGILNTTHIDVSCYWLISSSRMPTVPPQSEDCLYLNVYTPKLPSHCKNELLPVMVFIHGGGFMGGSSANNYPDLFMDKGVIMVSMNYRLGPFGFISTQDSVLPGNNGLKDQLFALQWINKNIEKFGGDSSRVTIFGQSTGGGSVGYHLLAQDKGFFQGAILQSGTCLSPAMFQRNPKPVAFSIGALLNSSFETNRNSQQLHDFLKGVGAELLNNATKQYINSLFTPLGNFLEVGPIFSPVIEPKNSEAFLTEKMYGLIKAGNVIKVPTLMGFMSEEKLGLGANLKVLKNLSSLVDEHLDYVVPADMRITDLENRTEIGTKIRNMYTGGEPFSQHVGVALRYSSDNSLTRPMMRHAELYSNFCKIYFYEYSYEGIYSKSEVHLEGAGNVGHGGEMGYLLCSGTGCTNSTIPQADLIHRQRLITLWTNFAKYQNPTPSPIELLENVTWPTLGADGQFPFLEIGEKLEVKDHPRENYPKWVRLYDSLGYEDFDTY